MNYLLVSDNDTLVQALGHVVTSRLGTLATAPNSDEAVRLLARANCAAVFVDARDISQCQSIRARWRGPIVLLVPGEAKSAALHGYQNGADLAIAVPCDARELVARVQALTRRHALTPSH